MTTDPFSVLGIAPTLEPARVKAAYFAALERHPPHRDPEGFRRLRAAYEMLSSPDGLAAAYLLAPLDLESERARMGARWDDKLSAARAGLERTLLRETALERFLAEVPRRTLTEALARAGAKGAT